MNARFEQMDGRFELMNIKLDSKSDIVEMLKETTKAQGGNHLQAECSAAGVAQRGGCEPDAGSAERRAQDESGEI